VGVAREEALFGGIAERFDWYLNVEVLHEGIPGRSVDLSACFFEPGKAAPRFDEVSLIERARDAHVRAR